MQTEESYVSWKAVQRVFFFFFMQTFFFLCGKLSLFKIVCGETTETWKVSVRRLIVGHAGGFLCMTWQQTRRWQEIYVKWETSGSQEEGAGPQELAVWPMWPNYLSLSSDIVRICETVKQVNDHRTQWSEIRNKTGGAHHGGEKKKG